MSTPADSVSPPPADRRERIIAVLGWAATLMAVLMYLSYVDQIQRNLAGHKGSVIQPLATVANCSLWCAYAFAKRVRDWPLALANAPGIVLGVAALVTALG